ncbi:MAG: epoxyqueuosine reductase QueH [Bacteroidales bacterium]|nr:epoxyqueuosine reductase QueH [Bacteroidales bacterium]
MSKNSGIEIPSGRILLHACCAPCSGAIVEYLVQHGCRPTVFYSNSNITPREEYDIRLNECIRYAKAYDLEIIADDYDHDAWSACAIGLENEPERGARCLQCFRFRLLRAAQYAATHGFDILTTTLASSRWKSLEQVNEAGSWACEQVNACHAEPPAAVISPTRVTWWPQNWRKGGLQERRSEIIREQNFYNQLFCGCEYSHRP